MKKLAQKVGIFAALSIVTLVGFGGSIRAEAKEQSQTIEYKDGDATLEGYYSVDLKSKNHLKGGIVIVHDWMGLGDQARSVAERLAGMGYAALAIDIYGKGVHPANTDEAGKLAGKYKGDRKLFRSRLRAGLDLLKSKSKLSDSQIVAIGYCFGGTGVLELGRSGAPIAGIVTFHGGLDSPTPADGKNIKSKVLVLHGAADPFVPRADVDAFLKELNDAKVDWQMISYAGAVHAFTNPKAGNDPSKGAAYQEAADHRSWEAMKQFLAEALPQ